MIGVTSRLYGEIKGTGGVQGAGRICRRVAGVQVDLAGSGGLAGSVGALGG